MTYPSQSMTYLNLTIENEDLNIGNCVCTAQAIPLPNLFSSPPHVERDQLLPAEPDHGGYPHGHPQLHLLLYLHEGQVRGNIAKLN